MYRDPHASFNAACKQRIEQREIIHQKQLARQSQLESDAAVKQLLVDHHLLTASDTITNPKLEAAIQTLMRDPMYQDKAKMPLKRRRELIAELFRVLDPVEEEEEEEVTAEQ
eukprot:TRINITY_DN899_c0_g1_i17.p2 TRINITY_DN899_c0_g1~~TRINITY_DN899_c0_g1_i17.p2  ORF type:complete len:112 (+),score=32.13 TRINITY_DN899_c0_g1_i17:471-806(+)